MEKSITPKPMDSIVHQQLSSVGTLGAGPTVTAPRLWFGMRFKTALDDLPDLFVEHGLDGPAGL